MWPSVDVIAAADVARADFAEEVSADPIGPNRNSATYTRFVNLLDLAAVAVPAAIRRATACRSASRSSVPAVPTPRCSTLASRFAASPTCVDAPTPELRTVAVVGAHLTGQPLNHQLTDRGAGLVHATTTAPEYRLLRAVSTTPPKPGLVRNPGRRGRHRGRGVGARPPPPSGLRRRIPAPLGVGRLAAGRRHRGHRLPLRAPRRRRRTGDHVVRGLRTCLADA